jgi:hypothetical protein
MSVGPPFCLSCKMGCQAGRFAPHASPKAWPNEILVGRAHRVCGMVPGRITVWYVVAAAGFPSHPSPFLGWI